MKYFLSVIRHKWFVIMASFKTGLPLWIALMHDMSKFSRAEFPHYNRRFCGKNDDTEGFARAWSHHKKCNDHHWQHWVKVFGGSAGGADRTPMTDIAILHTITDWIAFRRGEYGTWNPKKWDDPIGPYAAVIHPETRAKINVLIIKLGYKVGDG